jgi:radical SAM-linked protein
MGWKIIKLYFMIGLPTETDDDIAGIERLVRLVRKKSKDLNFNITISLFVPKAHTAFQWVPMVRAEEIKRKTDILKLLPATVKAHNHTTSVMEALIAKGDRRISAVIYKAWQKGARFDQWFDRFNNNIWNEALFESNIDLNFYVYRNIKYDEILPWEHLDFGVSKEALYAEYVKGINETSDVAVEQFSKAGCALPKNYVKPEISVVAPAMRLRLRFSKKGAVRFISHLEQIEVFRRAARRSGLPVAFTAGFSRQVKSSYGPPLCVGQESSSEYMELYFTQKTDLEDVKQKFSQVLPDGFKLLEVKRVPLLFPAIDVLSNIAEYEIKNAGIGQDKLDKFLSQEKILVRKIKKGKITEIDVKPLIVFFKNENNVLKLRLRFGNGKSVKPEIILQKLFEDQEIYGKIYTMERINLYVETKNGEIYNL